jgi:iron-sulfur cluster assembly protein
MSHRHPARTAAADAALRCRRRAAARPLRKAEDGKLLRIGVKTKGCSGMAYDLDFVDSAGPGDEVVKDKGLTVLVDRKASFLPDRHTMDYEVKPMSAGFTFVNPNEKGRCGCGESFTV